MKHLLTFLCLFAFWNPLHAEERYVVAIHGLLSDHTSMWPIQRTLQCDGMEVYAWDYPSIEGTTCDHASHLFQLLTQIAECRPGQPIDFVTHSIGAWILRQALNIEGCPEEAKTGRAVLLAPPNQGSRLAREYRNVPPIPWILGSKIGCELMSYGPCTIQSMGPFPETMQVLVIAGSRGNHILFNEPNDGFLAVSETALETPYYFEAFHVKHSALLTNAAVLNLTSVFLEYGCESKSPDEAPEPTEAETQEQPTAA